MREKSVISYPSHHFEPEDLLTFIHLRAFEQRWGALSLNDEDLRIAQIGIMTGPKDHPVMRRTGGLRKMRFAKPDATKGKSSSYRICYVYYEEYSIVLLVCVFGKHEKDNLSQADCNAIAKVIQQIKHELDNRPV